MDGADKVARVFLSIRGALARAVSGIVPPAQIEDVVQETYVRVCQARSLDEIALPKAFMFRTARNIALNYVNRAENRLSQSLDAEGGEIEWALLDQESDTLVRVCRSEDFALMCDAIRSLPVQCRRALVLKKVYGHSYKEIADKLQISEKTVEKHISKGVPRCKDYLADRAALPRGNESKKNSVGDMT